MASPYHNSRAPRTPFCLRTRGGSESTLGTLSGDVNPGGHVREVWGGVGCPAQIVYSSRSALYTLVCLQCIRCIVCFVHGV